MDKYFTTIYFDTILVVTSIRNIMILPNFEDIKSAQQRLKDRTKITPVMSSSLLNDWLGHDIFFKMECLQTTGAFKLRGATNFLVNHIYNKTNITKVIANSSGNHAQAVAYAAREFNLPVSIYCTKQISAVKAQATKFYGANLEQFDTRLEADRAVEEASNRDGTIWIPPFDHPDIISGQATATLEALSQVDRINAVFAPCGGGGLISGTLICSRTIDPDITVIGAEPLNANDAARSLRSGKIQTLSTPPVTLADGAATPSVGKLTFECLKQLDGFYEVSEEKIIYWTQWLQHLLKLHIEPTCAMTMDAVVEHLKNHRSLKRQRILVIISGGNISSESMSKIWKTDCLSTLPNLSNP